MIPRPHAYKNITKILELFPVAALLGPRQCGKTTLARIIAKENPSTFFDLENPVDTARLSAPMSVLENIKGPVIIDEIQRKPELFELLRVLADRHDNPAKFLILGSASPDMIKGASESLAGRIGFTDLLIMSEGKRYGFEFKYADTPGTTRSMRTAINDLALEHLWVVYPGKEEYDLDETISVITVSGILKLSSR